MSHRLEAVSSNAVLLLTNTTRGTTESDLFSSLFFLVYSRPFFARAKCATIMQFMSLEAQRRRGGRIVTIKTNWKHRKEEKNSLQLQVLCQGFNSAWMLPGWLRVWVSRGPGTKPPSGDEWIEDKREMRLSMTASKNVAAHTCTPRHSLSQESVVSRYPFTTMNQGTDNSSTFRCSKLSFVEADH